MYCHKYPSERRKEGFYYFNFYVSKLSTRVSSTKEEPVLEVEVTELVEPTEDCYWAWWETKDDRFVFCWPSRIQLEMCFPYGSKPAVDRWDGHFLPVRITEKRVVPKRELLMRNGRGGYS